MVKMFSRDPAKATVEGLSNQLLGKNERDIIFGCNNNKKAKTELGLRKGVGGAISLMEDYIKELSQFDLIRYSDIKRKLNIPMLTP